MASPIGRLAFRASWLLVALLWFVPSASAQHFGQNKVQYDDFKFEVLATEHFDIYYYPIEADAARLTARMAERWYGRLSTLFSHQLSSRQPVILYASHPEFEQTNVIEGLISESTGGVTEGGQRRVVLPLAATLGETDHVLGHELVHAFQYDILGPNIGRAPLWFIEGMAEYLSIGPRYAHTAMWLRDAALEGRLPEIRDLYDPRYFPYRFGHALWAYIGGRFGDEAVGATLHRLAPGAGGLGEIQALELTSALDDEELSTQWHASIYEMYGITPRDSEQVKEASRELPDAILAARAGSGFMNIGPSLSPDGSRIAFLSERSRLSIDVYVADTTTGENVRRLTSTAVDSHFESLQFLASSGSWAPDNRRLALASVQKGRGAVVIFDTQNGDVLHNIPLDERGEVFQPAWSPDGNSIAFVAQVGGFTDLFLHSLTDGTTRRLTTDGFADLQPAWSPDGQELVFVTDRHTSRLDTLAFGDMRLAVMTVATGQISPIETGGTGLTASPQWSSDGASFMFVSDRSGRPDIYRVSRTGGEPVPLTAIPTGVSGITPLSPALSVARTNGTTAYSVFRDGGYEIRLLGESPETTVAAPPTSDLAQLPPSGRVASVVAQQLSRPSAELPDVASFDTKPYSSGLSLIGIGQSLGASTGGGFGTYISGGISMLFSDVLGNHLVPVTFGIEGGVKDFAGQVSYVNRTSRWNWGVFGAHIPLRSGYVQAGLDVVNGVPVYLEQTELLRETSTQLGALVAYPFSRSTRLEVSGSVRRIGFGRERQTLGFDAVTGQFLFENTEDLAGFPALRLAETSVALVGDRTAFGPVGPVLGQRYRFEISPSFGDLRMTTASLDFRRYLMPVRPLTLAVRALHVGRYGSGGEDTRLFPLFLGYSTLVRGYDPGSFESSECTIAADGSCPEFDRLSGSRVLVVGGEARMPIGGFFTGNLDYGPIPTEVFGFYDAGVAWNRSERPQFLDGTRQWVSSVGVGARVNVFGYAVAELNMARALNRPGRGWQFVFNLGSSY
jgi:Tol biopolymer transport system component